MVSPRQASNVVCTRIPLATSVRKKMTSTSCALWLVFRYEAAASTGAGFSPMRGSIFITGRDAFHRVPKVLRQSKDAVERVPTVHRDVISYGAREYLNHALKLEIQERIKCLRIHG